ncbi:hypothetical protein GX563_08505 [Candidatus Bathyarchaeota archaeon]|nr:hypothetical protein [Candidatus Bathyarchaeota archaeon]
MSDKTQKTAKPKLLTEKQQTLKNKALPHIKKAGPIRLSCLGSGRNIYMVHVETTEGALAVIAYWRSRHWTKITVEENPKGNIPQLWTVTECIDVQS